MARSTEPPVGSKTIAADDDESERLAASFRPAWDDADVSDVAIIQPSPSAPVPPIQNLDLHPSVHEAPTVQVPPELDFDRTLKQQSFVYPKEDITLPDVISSRAPNESRAFAQAEDGAARVAADARASRDDADAHDFAACADVRHRSESHGKFQSFER